MTAQTAAAHRPGADLSGARLGFARLVRSEWIKLRSIRSTVWCYVVLVGLTIAMAGLLGAAFGGDGVTPTTDQANSTIVSINTSSVLLTALVVSVLGVLIITGEYGTGQVRSTFAADPGRTGVLLAKASVLAVTTFVVSVIATWIGVLVSVPLQAARGTHAAIGDPAVFLPVLGASVYVTLLALLAFGIGLIVRSTAAGITITVGLVLVVPTILQIIGGSLGLQWVLDVAAFLPDQAGGQLYTYASEATGAAQQGVVLDGWSGFSVLAGEVVAVGVLALALAKSRDV